MQVPKQVVTFTDDMLLNQVKRDSSKIASSFDKLCNEHLKEISTLISTVSMLVSYGLKKSDNKNHQLELACLELLTNALNSFTAATTLLRDGYRLQPGILIRNIIETMSTVLHLFIHQGDLSKFREGRLKSPDTIAAAKKVLPIFGRLYGFFSQEFAHLGTLHQSLQPLIPYTKFDDALSNNISFLRLTSLLMYMTTELICYKFVKEPRYWHYLGETEQGSRYAYNLSDEVQNWQVKYLMITDDLEE